MEILTLKVKNFLVKSLNEEYKLPTIAVRRRSIVHRLHIRHIERKFGRLGHSNNVIQKEYSNSDNKEYKVRQTCS